MTKICTLIKRSS